MAQEDGLEDPEEATDPAADGVRLRSLRADELEAAQALSMAAHWPHRPDDWRFAAALGEGFAAERDGVLVGCVLRWCWGERHATVGLLLVAPALRGRRIGQRLMQQARRGMDGRALLLHASAEGCGLYERLGFEAVGEFRQHQGRATPAPMQALSAGERLRPVGRADADRLVALDGQATGMPRARLVQALLDEGQTVVLDRNGEAVGFAVLRRFGRGQLIGPVIAPDLSGAQALIGHWAGLEAGRFLRIDVDAGSGLTEWLEDLGLERVGMARVMRDGPPLARGLRSGLYALASQALG